jgi:hypothetical protein
MARCVYKILVSIPEGKRPLLICRLTREDNKRNTI